MSDKAKDRISAIGNQLLPPINKVAPGSSKLRVEGKVVIITGTNSPLGIGRATAHQYAESGARALYLCDFDDTHLESHKKEINAAFPKVEIHTRQFDAADEDKVKEVVDDAIQRYGRLDVFFANAGIVGRTTLFSDFSKDEFMSILNTNTSSVFLAAKYAAPAMMKTSADKPHSSGSIIGTASVAGIRSNAGSTPYSASKAAVVSLAQTISYQLAGTGVRVNAICPGLIETGMTAPVYEAARARGSEKKIGQLNPMKRGGRADEIARVALFLGSDEASYVNGQAWAVDGGLSAGHPFVPGKLVNQLFQFQFLYQSKPTKPRPGREPSLSSNRQPIRALPNGSAFSFQDVSPDIPMPELTEYQKPETKLSEETRKHGLLPANRIDKRQPREIHDLI